MKSAAARILAADLTLAVVTAIWGLGFTAIGHAINASVLVNVGQPVFQHKMTGHCSEVIDPE